MCLFQRTTYVVKKGLFSRIFSSSWRLEWISMTSDLKFSSGSYQLTTIRGCMRNFSLLSRFLGPNAACTKFGVTKCRIVPPPPLNYGKPRRYSYLMNLDPLLTGNEVNRKPGKMCRLKSITEGKKTCFQMSNFLVFSYRD